MLGRGGMALVARATGISTSTIARGLKELRARGEIVVQCLTSDAGGADPGDFDFDRELRRVGAGWQVAAREGAPVVK